MSREEYDAKRVFLRDNPQGFRARQVARELRAHERELREQGLNVEQWAHNHLSIPWFVAQMHGRRTGRVRHTHRECSHIADLPASDVRPTTKAELDELPPCESCS